MKSNFKKTTKCYLDWLEKTQLRYIFSKNMTFENISIWWITKLVDKDNILDNNWYLRLNEILNNQKVTPGNKNVFPNIILIFKLIKKFVASIIFATLVKIFLNDKYNEKIKKNNCFHSQFRHIVKMGKIYSDHQYSYAPLQNKTKNFFLIDLNNNDFKIFFNLFKTKNKLSQIPLHYIILNKRIFYKDIVKIYFKIFVLYFRLIFILRKKNYFIINNKDCSSVLKPFLLESFFGDIQHSLINASAAKNLFKEKKIDNFINYGEFFSGFRSTYHFIKLSSERTKLISITHGIYSENNLFYSLNKKEFSKGNDSLYYSPKPDVFLPQGTKHAKILKKTFPYKKVFPIGSFKFDLADYNFNKLKIIKRLNKLKKKNNKKKIIVILTALNDEKNIVNFLNKCDLSDFFIILSPHPYFIKESILEFNNNFKYKFKVFNDLSTRQVICAADLVITGYTSVGFEVLIRKGKVLKVSDSSSLDFSDQHDKIPLINSAKDFQKYLKKKKFVSLFKIKKVEKDFFYKFDNKTYLRFWKVLNKL